MATKTLDVQPLTAQLVAARRAREDAERDVNAYQALMYPAGNAQTPDFMSVVDARMKLPAALAALDAAYLAEAQAERVVAAARQAERDAMIAAAAPKIRAAVRELAAALKAAKPKSDALKDLQYTLYEATGSLHYDVLSWIEFGHRYDEWVARCTSLGYLD